MCTLFLITTSPCKVHSFCILLLPMCDLWSESNFLDTFPHQKYPWIPYFMIYQMFLVRPSAVLWVPYTGVPWFNGYHDQYCLVHVHQFLIGWRILSVPYNSSGHPVPSCLTVSSLLVSCVFPLPLFFKHCCHYIFNQYLFQ